MIDIRYDNQINFFLGDNKTFVDKIYDTLHYVPVIRNNIETIDIDIRSELGKPIQFTTGRVITKLHFRKRSYY